MRPTTTAATFSIKDVGCPRVTSSITAAWAAKRRFRCAGTADVIELCNARNSEAASLAASEFTSLTLLDRGGPACGLRAPDATCQRGPIHRLALHGPLMKSFFWRINWAARSARRA